MLHRRWLGIVGAIAIAIGSTSGSATAAGPSGQESSRSVGAAWGYVVARHPTLGDYTPADDDQGSSVGGTNTVRRSSAGSYLVRFGGLAVGGGTAHVTAVGTARRSCTILFWDPDGSDLVIRVRCFAPGGARADTAFSLNFVAVEASTSEIAYAWADQPTSASYTPALGYQHNHTGATNTVTRHGAGSYEVHIPGATIDPIGNVQVTAYAGTALACQITSWSGTNMYVNVLVTCRDHGGTPTDTPFTVSWMRDVTLRGEPGGRSAYVYAYRPHVDSYQPGSGAWYTSWGTRPTILRTSQGRYTIELTGIPAAGGSVQVAKVGGTLPRCRIRNIATSGAIQWIGVSCDRLDGTPADTYFNLVYTR